MLQTGLLPSSTLAEFFRFAVLLTGDSEKASRIVSETLVANERRAAEIRDEDRRAAWLAARIRRACIGAGNGTQPPAESLPEGTGANAQVDLARRFHELPEPERSSLALFYLDAFSSEQIAQILELKLEQLSEMLDRGRKILRSSLSEP